MTRHAERHQIIYIMRAAVSNLFDVMHECRANISALVLAPLAERMECYVPIANPSPRAPVSLLPVVAAREVLVMPLHGLLVFVTVPALTVRKTWTPCHAAGSFRLPRHPSHAPSYDKIPQRRGSLPFFARFSYDFRAHKKSTAAAVPLCFSAYTIAHVVCEIL